MGSSEAILKVFYNQALQTDIITLVTGNCLVKVQFLADHTGFLVVKKFRNYSYGLGMV